MNRKVRIALLTVVGALVAVAALTGAGVLWAGTLSSHYPPETVNFQGYLTDSGGNPISSTVTLEFSIWDASTAGNQVWSETHNNVSVTGGYFSVLLGSQGSPVTPSVLKGTPRYVQVVYSGTTFPRQVLASVPYAIIARESITATYATTATYALSSGSSSSGVDWEYVVVVAKSGGDYTSLGAALGSITPSSSSRYLILVMPGLYTEQVTLPEYVHVKGAGIHNTVISSQANTGNFNDAAAATLAMGANSQLSDIAVYNTSNTQDGVAVRISGGNSSTVLDNVRIRNTDGGDQRIGLYLTSSSPNLTHVQIEVSNGTSNNWGIFNSASSPTIHDTTVKATNTGSAGLRMNGGNPIIAESTFDGSNGSNGQGINTSGAGTHVVTVNRSSIIGDTGTGSSIASTDDYDFFVGASLLDGDVDVFGSATIKCAQSYNGAYSELLPNCTFP